MNRSKVGALALIAAIAMPAPASQATAADQTTAASSPFRAGPDGSMIHHSTEIAFPRASDGFVRVSIQALDNRNESVVVVYERGKGDHKSAARVTLVQIDDMSAHEHFAGMAPIVGTYFDGLHFTDIKPISDGPLDLAGVPPRNAWQGHFTAVRGKEHYILSLSTLDMGNWGGRVTAAYPRDEASDIQKRLNALVGKIRATGPTHVHAGD